MARIRPTLRLLVSGVCALVVLIVATITLVITITTSTATIRDVGEDYAGALADAARTQVTAFMRTPDVQLRAISDAYAQGFLDLSVRSSDKRAYADASWRLLYTAAVNFNFSFSTFGILFDDWGGHRIDSPGIAYPDPNIVPAQVVTYDGPDGVGPRVFNYAADKRTGRMVPNFTRAPITNVSTDPRFAAYHSTKTLVATDPRTFSVGINIYAVSAL